MKKNAIFLFLAVLLLSGRFLVNGVLAGTADLPGIDLSIDDLEDILLGLVCWIYRMAFALIVIFIIWTGIRYLYSGGNPQKISQIHQAFLWVFIGAVVILGVGVIIATISAALDLPSITPIIC